MPPQGETAQALAAVAAAIDHVLGERKRRISGQMTGRDGHARAPARGPARRDWIALDVAREAGGIAVRFVGGGGSSDRAAC